jgi:orotate phosphoribosyltransferase-like protein
MSKTYSTKEKMLVGIVKSMLESGHTIGETAEALNETVETIKACKELIDKAKENQDER